MKRILIALVTFALVVAGTAANAGGQKVKHRVSVGGADLCEAVGEPTGCDANFSLVAVERADGTVVGQWQDSWGSGYGGIHVAIDCLLVDGNQAFVSGVITKGFAGGEDLTGLVAVTTVIDNGTSQKDPQDQISLSIWDVGLTCRNPNIIRQFFPLFALTHGQVKVR
jgi:hypothetical protein